MGPGFLVAVGYMGPGNWATDTDQQSSIRVYDLAYQLLFDSGTTTFPGTGHLTQTFGITSASGLRLQWGPNGYNGGADNISFSVQPIVAGAIPEPATWAMLLLGFSMIGAVSRYRRRSTVITHA